MAVGFLAAGFLVADFLAACLLLSGCLVLWLVAPVSKFQMHTPNSLPLCMSNKEHIIYQSFFFNVQPTNFAYRLLFIIDPKRTRDLADFEMDIAESNYAQSNQTSGVQHNKAGDTFSHMQSNGDVNPRGEEDPKMKVLKTSLAVNWTGFN